MSDNSKKLNLSEVFKLLNNDPKLKLMRELNPPWMQLYKKNNAYLNILKETQSLRETLNHMNALTRASNSLFFPQSILTSSFSIHRQLAEIGQLDTLQKITEAFRQQSSFTQRILSAVSTEDLIEIFDDEIVNLPQDIQDSIPELVNNLSAQSAFGFESTANIETQTTVHTTINIQNNYFLINPQNKSIILLIILFILDIASQIAIGQFNNATYQYSTQPTIESYLSPNIKDHSNIVSQCNTLYFYGIRITEVGLNLRVAPSLNSKIITTLEQGTKICIIDDPILHKDWLKVITYIDNKMIDGFVNQHHTTKQRMELQPMTPE